MNPKTDCRYILWDRPCEFHKETGAECPLCRNYMPKGKNILIIKLDAMGDVLRTTSILQGIKEKYPDSFITWITMPASEELLKRNAYIDRVFTKDLDIISVLQNEEFDLVLNPDASLRSALLTAMARSRNKLGMGYEKNKVIPLNKEAVYWYSLGMDDKLKKANKKTYQDILFEMFKLPKGKNEIILNIAEDAISFARDFAKKHNLRDKKTVIGINTGAGRRWALKSWPKSRTLDLIILINRTIKDTQMILLGGPEERERNKIIMSGTGGNIIDAGTENSIRNFISIINLCDLVVVTDSLALHIALALGKKVVVLFGPTSSAEIEVYGRGMKVVPSMDCLCCYKRNCDKKPNCMDSIMPEDVLQCIQKLL